jgi:hypothetical protein
MSPSANGRSKAPGREDHGDLIALYLRGSYREMGEQQIRLLGDLARQIFDLRRGDWDRLISGSGPLAKAGDVPLSHFWSWWGPRYEESSYFEEIRGIAKGLGVRRVEALRGVFGWLGAGSTVFLATRAATADGHAIIGKNSDWPDGNGLQRPLVTHYYPTNGDLAHIMAAWPLVCLPGVGINEAGFAISLNFFIADQIVGIGLAQWPLRRALQRAKTVNEGIEIFRRMKLRGLSGFVCMADAAGDIAMVECTPTAMAVFRPEDDWFVQTNHARTPPMLDHDRGRSPDTFERYRAVEQAVMRNIGRITPTIAADILRDRSNSRYINGSVVGNLSVLNSAVVQPATKTLWHSTSMQPLAPFGEMVAFSPAEDAVPMPSVAKDARLDTAAMEREAAVVAEARRTLRLFGAGKIEDAGRAWEHLQSEAEGLLEPERLVWARALVQFRSGRLEEADHLFTQLDQESIPFDLRAYALLAHGLLADRQGRRPDAVRFYQQAHDYIRGHPYNHQFLVAPLERHIVAGMKAPQTAESLAWLPALQRVPS